MKPKTCQNGPQMGPRRWPGGPNSGEKTVSKQKGREHATDPPFFGRKSRQHGSNLGPKMEPKSHKNRYKNQSKNQCILGSIFGRILVDLGRQNGAKLAPKSYQKLFSTSKGDFLKKPRLSIRKTMILKVLGVDVGSKNRSKNEVKMGRHLDMDFWRILVDLGSQVGRENPPKVDPKNVLKNIHF